MNEICLSVLTYFDNQSDSWVSVALEMDLYGHGDTPEKSFSDLHDLVKMQLGFSQYKNDPDLIFRPAPVELFNLYAQVRQEAIRNYSKKKKIRETGDYIVSGLPLPSQSVINKIQKGFALSHA